MPVTPAPTTSTSTSISTSGADPREPWSGARSDGSIGLLGPSRTARNCTDRLVYSMDFSLTEAERELAGLCRDFAQNEIAPRAPQAWEAGRCPTDLLREMGALGLLGILVPEEWGGIGMSTVGF